jgi:hypothetical protein
VEGTIEKDVVKRSIDICEIGMRVDAVRCDGAKVGMLGCILSGYVRLSLSFYIPRLI